MMPACSTMTVSSRQYCPSWAIAGPFSAPSRHSALADGSSRPAAPPLSIASTTSMTVLSASSVSVTTGRPRSPARRTLVRSLASSGQNCPTAAGTAHSPQIGRPQREQRSPVSRSGCR